ncbi:unnamed protein product [Lathyrus sativus]|nr:unnamed protein product [Lathyrus sativus]
MKILLFDGEDEAYWWILCFEKFFKEHGTSESLKVLKAVGTLRGRALKWWQWRSKYHSWMSWNTFAEVFRWHFKPEWRHLFLKLDEEIEPTYTSVEPVVATSFPDDFIDDKFRDATLATIEQNHEESPDLNGKQPEQLIMDETLPLSFTKESDLKLNPCSTCPPPSKTTYFCSYDADDELLLFVTDEIKSSTGVDALISNIEPYDPGPPKPLHTHNHDFRIQDYLQISY